MLKELEGEKERKKRKERSMGAKELKIWREGKRNIRFRKRE